MKVLLFGASGMVGQGVLRECLLDPAVEQVVSIGRSSTGQKDAKFREIVHADLWDYAAIERVLADFDACFWCLGVTAAGKTEAEYERQADLSSRQVASKQALDNALANRDAAQAKLKQAQVDTSQAEINFGYTQVKAPFDGFVTARLVSLGEFVGANGPTQLATIVQTDPIYVNFTISEQEVLRVRAEIRRLGLTPADLKKVPVEVGLQGDEGYPYKGTLDYASPSMNQAEA